MVEVITKEVVVEDSVVETVAALDKHLLRGAKTMAMVAAMMVAMAVVVDMVAALKVAGEANKVVVATAAVAKEATVEDLAVDKVEVKGVVLVR